jgi:hypothetical protein
MGLILLPLFALYVLISIIIVICAIIFAKKHKRNVWLWGGGAAFIMYNLLFWDWIPTVAVHKYYCSTQAGYWVYKTADQWKAENPGVLETLPKPKPTGVPLESIKFDNYHGERDIYHLNDRLSWIVTRHDIWHVLPIIRKEEVVKDVKKNEILGRYVDFSTGHTILHKSDRLPGGIKLWLNSGNCSGGRVNEDKMGDFFTKFYGEAK